MRPAGQYREMALRVRESAQARFWYGVGGYCFDVVDSADGDDPSLRPNQVIALALVYPLIEGARARSVLDRATAKLPPPDGLRTLSPYDTPYQPSYSGDRRTRGAGYQLRLASPWL